MLLAFKYFCIDDYFFHELFYKITCLSLWNIKSDNLYANNFITVSLMTWNLRKILLLEQSRFHNIADLVFIDCIHRYRMMYPKSDSVPIQSALGGLIPKSNYSSRKNNNLRSNCSFWNCSKYDTASAKVQLMLSHPMALNNPMTPNYPMTQLPNYSQLPNDSHLPNDSITQWLPITQWLSVTQ